MWKMDAGAGYTILKGNGTVSARFSDIFNTMRFSNSKPYQTGGQFNWESQTVYSRFNYRFGDGKTKQSKENQRDKNETQSGLL
jgi:hypothetical protein